MALVLARLVCRGAWRHHLGWELLALLVLLPALWTHRAQIRAAPLSAWLKALLGPLAMAALAMSLWLVPMLEAVTRSGDPLPAGLQRQHIAAPDGDSLYQRLAPRQTVLVLPLGIVLLDPAVSGCRSPAAAPWWWPGGAPFRAQDRRILLLLGLMLVVLFSPARQASGGVCHHARYARPRRSLTAPFIGTLLVGSGRGGYWLGSAGWEAGLVGAWCWHLATEWPAVWGNRGRIPWLPLLVLGIPLLLINAWLRRTPLTAILCSPGGGVADLLLLDKRAPQQGAHPSGSHGIGGAEGAWGDELLLAGFREAASAV